VRVQVSPAADQRPKKRKEDFQDGGGEVRKREETPGNLQEEKQEKDPESEETQGVGSRSGEESCGDQGVHEGQASEWEKGQGPEKENQTSGEVPSRGSAERPEEKGPGKGQGAQGSSLGDRDERGGETRREEKTQVEKGRDQEDHEEGPRGKSPDPEGFGGEAKSEKKGRKKKSQGQREVESRGEVPG
jgi:hypothetical protein